MSIVPSSLSTIQLLDLADILMAHKHIATDKALYSICWTYAFTVAFAFSHEQVRMAFNQSKGLA